MFSSQHKFTPEEPFKGKGLSRAKAHGIEFTIHIKYTLCQSNATA